eukprot:scaffold12761_cov112-Isochrysis_galbana.AAC.3
MSGTRALVRARREGPGARSRAPHARRRRQTVQGARGRRAPSRGVWRACSPRLRRRAHAHTRTPGAGVAPSLWPRSAAQCMPAADRQRHLAQMESQALERVAREMWRRAAVCTGSSHHGAMLPALRAPRVRCSSRYESTGRPCCAFKRGC